MNNNTPPINSSSSSGATGGISKNIQRTNGTDSGFYTGDGAINNARPAASSSRSSELACNTCLRSSSGNSTSSAAGAESIVVRSQPSSDTHQAVTSTSSAYIQPNFPTTDDDEEDGVDSDDQYVYTYKGDGSSQHPSRLAADLPSSFFKLHPSDSSFPPSSSSREIPSLETSSSSRCCATSSSRVQNGTTHPVNVNQNNNAMYSPDMDFLEMDFDPGGSGDGCCDGDDEDEDEDIVRDHLHTASSSSSQVPYRADHISDPVPGTSRSARNNNNVLKDDHSTAAVVLSKLVVTRSNGGGCISSNSMLNDRRNEPVAHCSKQCNTNYIDCGETSASAITVNSNRNNPRNNSTYAANASRSEEIKLRLVKSVTLPEMGTPTCRSSGDSQSGVSYNSNPSNRAMAMSISAPVFSDKAEGPYPTVIPARKSSEDSMELEVEGAMIWHLHEAREISINQIGKSACGATACLNVLKALGCIMTTLSPEFVSNCVGTRLRAEDAELPEYLLSRSNAGTTHEDLIAGIHRASNGLIYGRFFQINPTVGPSQFNKWLLYWICKGAVPIATLNLQIKRYPEIVGGEIPDAWHHQMVFGMSKHGIFLTNPLECVPTVNLLRHLSSQSVLLVRREDVTRRNGPRTDLRKLARFADPRWNEMNVLGQVSNMLLEEMPVLNGSAGLARRIRTTHITIPADYKSGITLFIRESNTTSCALLKAAPEF
ncbi:unnamed protein product [Orchesella dallaii]|uniref:Glutathione gamma-glutamylcysteinyltransferase n=1 Tax=Orchesella dallaii TaxID=48710 RepID=A0ABP1PKS4_9HEXA